VGAVVAPGPGDGTTGFGAGLWFKLGRIAILGNLSTCCGPTGILIFMFAGFQVCQQPRNFTSSCSVRLKLCSGLTSDHTMLKGHSLPNDDGRHLATLLSNCFFSFCRHSRANGSCINDNNPLACLLAYKDPMLPRLPRCRTLRGGRGSLRCRPLALLVGQHGQRAVQCL
jgi:hypothetical protein